MKKNFGILTGTNDTIYYSYPPPPNNKYGPSGPFHLHVAVQAQANSATNGADFDLYARCGAFPTQTTFDQRSYSSTRMEFLDITQSCNTTWYFAVNSYSGAGTFALTVGEGGDENVLCFALQDSSGTMTTATKTTLANNLTTRLKAFYGATGGGILPIKIVYINGNVTSTSTACGQDGQQHIVTGAIDDGCTRSRVDYNGLTDRQPIHYCASDLGATSNIGVAEHEFSHHYWRFPDEYTDANGTGCGHSIMGQANSFSYCTSFNHRLDNAGTAYTEPGQPPLGSCTSSTSCPGVAPWGDSVSMWQKIAGVGPGWIGNYFNEPINVTLSPSSPRMYTATTPENYTYTDFDFNADGQKAFIQSNQF